MGVILSGRNVYKEFMQRGELTPVLKNINIDIDSGEFVVIMGNSGAGKSTLLYSLAGLDSVTSGDITRLKPNEMGFVFQDYHLIPNLTVLDNILVGNFKLDRKTAVLKAHSLLKSMDIDELSNRFPNEISGGEQQRVSLSRALINSPEILFADEPTGNLNSALSKNIMEILEEQNRTGQTIVMVSHELRAAARGSRVIYLKDGEVVDSHKLDLMQFLNQRTNILFKWLSEKGW